MAQFYKQGTDVYQVGQTNPITQQQFQDYGLNYNLLSSDPTKPTTLDTGRDTETKAYIAQGGALGTPNAALNAITPESLTQTNPLNLTYPGTTTPYPVDGLGTPDQTLTPKEKEVQKTLQEGASLEEQTLGKSAFQAQQEQQFGVGTITRTLNDLTAQLVAIQNEAKAIPVEAQSRSAQGAILTGGLQADVNQRLRDNAVKALGVSTLLAAAQGQLATAQDLADRAVAQKFDPIFERIRVNKANLDRLLSDPELSVQDRNRALRQKEIQNKLEQEANDKKDNALAIRKMALEALQNGASTAIASQLNKLAESDDPDIDKAFSIYAPYAVAPKTGTIPGEMSPYQIERNMRNIQSVGELEGLALQNPGIFGRTAALPLPGFLRTDAYRDFKSQLDTLKANITFGELTAMREASKTGGALGQVSDTEGRLLGAALGSLEMSQTPENFVAQLRKIRESIQRWQNAVAANGGGSNVITAPDGTQVQIID